MEHLYMFAIMPPADLAARIDNERKNFAEQYNCIKALKPPVHITLYEPFKEDDEIETKFAALHRWADEQAPFTIEVKNFNFFNNPHNPVIYIDVIASPELRELRSKFLTQLKRYIDIERSNNKYTPHFTIGYRDIPPAIFPAIMQQYSRHKFSGSFMCNAVHLWRHDGKNWQVRASYALNGKQPAPTLF